MDFNKALEFPFKDPNWLTKMVWLSVFMLLSPALIGIPFVVGYMILTIRGVIKGKEGLPEWSNNWSEILTEGLKYCVVVLVIVIADGFVSAVGIGLFTFAWDIVAIILSLLTMAKLAATGNLNDLLDFDWYVAFTKRNGKNIFIVFIFSIIGAVVAGFGVVAFVIGIFFTMYVYVISYAHLVGQMYKIGEGASVAASVVEPASPDVTV